MIDLAFRIDDIVCEPYAAVPQLTARLEISERTGKKAGALGASLPGADRAPAPCL